MREITIDELLLLKHGEYVLFDIRPEEIMQFGAIPNAIKIDLNDKSQAERTVCAVPKDKKIIFYCQVGKNTQEIDDKPFMRECYSLKGGYVAYIMHEIQKGENDSAKQKKAEDSIKTTFHERLFTPFAKACKTYGLIDDGDNIAVCISGGKDSMLMAKLFQEIQRHKKKDFKLTFLVMDPGYNRENRQLLESNAKSLGVPITVFESTIFDTVDTIEKSPCYLCARMRRGYLYSKAQELGCNKIALGHHYDDVIETILMGMLHSGQIQTMMPKLHSANFKGMQLIRPLYLVREKDICAWRDYNDLHFLQCACHFTETCSTCHEDGTTASKRLETKKLIAELKKTNPFIEANIFKSVENVNLDTVIAYKQKGVRHSFLDEYDKW